MSSSKSRRPDYVPPGEIAQATPDPTGLERSRALWLELVDALLADQRPIIKP